MNKSTYKQLILLLGRLTQEYDIDIEDHTRFDDYERGLLRTAREDAKFHGRQYEPLRVEDSTLEAGAKRKSKGKTAGV